MSNGLFWELKTSRTVQYRKTAQDKILSNRRGHLIEVNCAQLTHGWDGFSERRGSYLGAYGTDQSTAMQHGIEHRKETQIASPMRCFGTIASSKQKVTPSMVSKKDLSALSINSISIGKETRKTERPKRRMVRIQRFCFVR